MLRTALPLFFLSPAIVGAAQASIDFAARYGASEAAIRRSSGNYRHGCLRPDKTGCQMIVQPKPSISKNDMQSEVIPRSIAAKFAQKGVNLGAAAAENRQIFHARFIQIAGAGLEGLEGIT